MGAWQTSHRVRVSGRLPPCIATRRLPATFEALGVPMCQPFSLKHTCLGLCPLLGDALKRGSRATLAGYCVCRNGLYSVLVGYHGGVRYKLRSTTLADPSSLPMRSLKRFILAGGLTYLAYSASHLHLYGTKMSDITSNLVNPGEAYKSRFRMLEEVGERGDFRGTMLVAVVFGLTYFLVPLATVTWNRLSFRYRVFAVASAGSYGLLYALLAPVRGSSTCWSLRRPEPSSSVTGSGPTANRESRQSGSNLPCSQFFCGMVRLSGDFSGSAP